MSQYKTGTASVTNGSQIVTGSGTAWLANVQPGDGFTIAGTQVPYTVGSVDSDTQITLSAPYAGASGSGLAYAIWRDFTTNENLPELAIGDIETPTIWTRAMRKIDALIGAATTTSRGTVEKATTTEAENATAGKYPDAAGVHAAFNQYGLGPTFRALLGSLNSPLFNGMGYVPSSDPNTPSTQFSEAFEVLSFLDENEQYGIQEATGQRSYRKFHRSKFAGSWQTWREVYKQNSILGTVSQSGGVPTGAIIERGSNANGEYTKFADGAVEAWGAGNVDTFISASLIIKDVPLPVNILTSGRSAVALRTGIESLPADSYLRYITSGLTTVSDVRLSIASNSGGLVSGDSATIIWYVKGRWF